MAPAPDKALWVGDGGNHLGDGTELVPHETIVAITHGEAEASDNWEPIKGAGKPKAKRKRAPKAKAPKAPDVASQRTVPSESAGTQTGAGAPSEPGGEG